MRNIISYFPKEELKDSTTLFNERGNVTFSGGGNSSSKAMLVSDILRSKGNERRNVLWIVSDKEMESAVKKAMDIWGDKKVFVYKNEQEVHL